MRPRNLGRRNAGRTRLSHRPQSAAYARLERQVNAHEWLAVHHGAAPLIVSFPHTGTEIPASLEPKLVSPWLARKDADHWVDVLYDFAHGLGATTIRTALSRTAIDVNRDPAGVSLYPGQTTTGLCPVETFAGEALYKPGCAPDAAEIARRRVEYFDPYHAALRSETERLRAVHRAVVVYDAHSILSRAPRLFEGELPQFNIGTDNGTTCSPALTAAIEAICDRSGMSRVTNGRFRGGWITRHYGKPQNGIHAIQMELAMRGYLEEPTEALTPTNWPLPLDDTHASTLRVALRDILDACIAFATGQSS
ncbi:MAG: N-formylglutamate deformylase [Steroidobacteraceae bacterium]|nr:N-formylglutamate deformylase [Steroidobacteraceae bacterium]